MRQFVRVAIAPLSYHTTHCITRLLLLLLLPSITYYCSEFRALSITIYLSPLSLSLVCCCRACRPMSAATLPTRSSVRWSVSIWKQKSPHSRRSLLVLFSRLALAVDSMMRAADSVPSRCPTVGPDRALIRSPGIASGACVK